MWDFILFPRNTFSAPLWRNLWTMWITPPGAPYRPTQVSKILLIKSTKSLRNRQISVFLQHTPGPVFPRRRLKESLPKAPGSAPSLALRTAKAGDFLPAETDPALPGTVLQNDSEISILFTDFFLILWYDIFV